MDNSDYVRFYDLLIKKKMLGSMMCKKDFLAPDNVLSYVRCMSRLSSNSFSSFI
jgi:hypothetical protein